MKKIVKCLIFVFILILLIFSIVYLDYYSARANGNNPKISIKEENDNYILYKAAFYKVYYCKTNKKYIFADYKENVVCPRNYNYNNGYYTNSEEINISKKDLQLLLSDGVYTSEMIEHLKTESEVKNAVYVANNFGLLKYKALEETEEYNVVIFPTFDKSNNNYEWLYNDDSEKYCLKGENYNYYLARYIDDKCGKYEKVKMEDNWCELYSNSTLVYVKGIENLCK